jgi:hypothetical protein
MQSEVRKTRPFNGFHGRETLIGMVHTPETREHRISYETASWYTLVDVAAGDYEIVLSESSPGMKWVLVRYAGTITDEHFVNRLFGSSSLAEKRNLGRQIGCTSQFDVSIAAEKFVRDDEWELAEDWRIVMTPRPWHGVKEPNAPVRKAFELVNAATGESHQWS